MTFEEEMKKSIEELVEKKTALEKRIFELEKENEDLKKQIDCYKAFESHYDEIEEDAKAIAEENEELKAQIERMKCCENCEYENFEKYHGGKCNLGNYKTCGNWEIRK